MNANDFNALPATIRTDLIERATESMNRIIAAHASAIGCARGALSTYARESIYLLANAPMNAATVTRAGHMFHAASVTGGCYGVAL